MINSILAFLILTQLLFLVALNMSFKRIGALERDVDEIRRRYFEKNLEEKIKNLKGENYVR